MPKTTQRNYEHKVYPYLLRDLEINIYKMTRLIIVHLKLLKSTLRADVEFKFYFYILEEGYIIGCLHNPL